MKQVFAFLSCVSKYLFELQELTKTLFYFFIRIVMISNRCTRKKENVLIANMRTVRGHQNLRKMEMLIANPEAVVVLPRHHHHPGIIMILRESDTCHQSFVKQIICMKNKQSIEESYLISVESTLFYNK